jgi:Tfp pilus assembly protein PilN
MVRINLLPKEILERRRYEKWYPYVLIFFAAMLALVAIVYGYFWLSGAQKNADLQLLQEQSQKLQAQADAFGVFEQKEQDLVKRQTIATNALAGRLNMGRVAEEVSLVLPDEVWLQQMGISQADGLTVSGNTPYSSSHSMDVSYKSVAKTLVRLNELDDVTDVWLTTAANAEFSSFAPVAGVTPLPASVVAFSVKGKVNPAPADSAGAK